MIKLPDGKRLMVVCPDCDAPNLIVRTNRANDSQFLGCPNWPACKHTQAITQEIQMRLQGQPSLFDRPEATNGD